MAAAHDSMDTKPTIEDRNTLQITQFFLNKTIVLPQYLRSNAMLTCLGYRFIHEKFIYITILLHKWVRYAYQIIILKGIRAKIDEIGEWRRIHSEELRNLYRSPNIVRVIKSRRLRWTGHVAKMEESRSAFKILTGKPKGKRTLGRSRHRGEENIRIDPWGLGEH